MEICKEFRVEWESVVFFCMNENVGEERGEKEERAEEWWWWCGVLWCGGVCLYAAQQISIKGVYTAMALRCHTEGHRQEWSLRRDSTEHGKAHQVQT